MINISEIDGDWLSQVSKRHGNADKILVEKVIRAFLLLEGLAKQQIPFVFKGGTSLMLHFESIKRLSIDVDIILPISYINLDKKLDALTTEQGFIRYEPQHRSKTSGIKKAHYKLYYTPLHRTNKVEEYILLDVLYEDVNYSKLVSLPIQSKFVPIEYEPISISVPSMEDLLGDKLTAFAPNTTGIPYVKKGDSMGMEIIKQLYDIGKLFDAVINLEDIKTTFYRFAQTEIDYRLTEGISELDVLNDIFQTALCIVSRGADGHGQFEVLQDGIGRIRPFIFSENYHIEKAIAHASKAAYLSMLIQLNAKEMEKFENPQQVIDWQIEKLKGSKLNRLKKSNPEAFFYWYHIYKIKEAEG